MVLKTYISPFRPLTRLCLSFSSQRSIITKLVEHARSASTSTYGAVVAGSGPAGVAVVGNLLEKKLPDPIAWVDPDFTAGRLHKDWREVPSNTKVNLFVAFAEALQPFREIIERTPEPNAISKLKELKQDEGCQISYSADMCRMLVKGLREQRADAVEQRLGYVTGANWNGKTSTWAVQIQPASSSNRLHTIQSRRIILCSGATATTIPLPLPDLSITNLALETALTPSYLKDALPTSSPATVAVIGSSHSAILALMNLSNLARCTHPQLKINWFTRSDLLYAIPKDGWILYDNTGLKGLAATFAHENLEPDKLPQSPVGKALRRIDCSGNDGPELAKYEQYLPECSHIMYATGFAPNPMPKLTRDGAPIKGVQYDHEGGGFVDANGEKVEGLFGAGIAYPERVTDPVGNVEMSVGMWKFMKYLRRVVGDWVGETGKPGEGRGQEKAVL